MDIFSKFTEQFRSIAKELLEHAQLVSDFDESRILAEPPRDELHGDVATNAALILSKALRRSPQEVAQRIVTRLAGQVGVESVEVAPAGFVNLRLNPSIWQQNLVEILKQGQSYGASNTGARHRVNLEYVSTNPTGPLHVGHCRCAVFGDSLANLLEFVGYDVTREYYMNDAGGQVDTLVRSVFWRYREALGKVTTPCPEGLYPGDYLIPVGTAMVEKYGEKLLSCPESEALTTLRAESLSAMMDLIRADLERLGIQHDVFFSEASLHGAGGEIESVLKYFEEKDLVYRGHLPPPKGKIVEDWENREQLLFRATHYGDETDRPLVKADGNYTYFAADAAYFKAKFDRNFQTMIYVFGADHSGYVARLQALAKAISDGKAQAMVCICQLVRFLRHGEVVKMSKRGGSFVTLQEVIEEVGADSIRFMLLFRKNDAPLDFDFEHVKERSKDNPVFYVQYASARCHSILRQAERELPEALESVRKALLEGENAVLERWAARLTAPGELALLRLLAQWPRLVERAAQAYEPHRIAFYLYSLATVFHAHWNTGKEKPELRFVCVGAVSLSCARLLLVQGVLTILQIGLGLMGVNAPQEMQ